MFTPQTSIYDELHDFEPSRSRHTSAGQHKRGRQSEQRSEPSCAQRERASTMQGPFKGIPADPQLAKNGFAHALLVLEGPSVARL